MTADWWDQNHQPVNRLQSLSSTKRIFKASFYPCSGNLDGYEMAWQSVQVFDMVVLVRTAVSAALERPKPYLLTKIIIYNFNKLYRAHPCLPTPSFH